MLNVALMVPEESDESVSFQKWLESEGINRVPDHHESVVDVLVVVDRQGLFSDRRSIYHTYGPLIGEQTEIFYIFAGGIRFAQVQIHDGHDKFFHVGAFDGNFFKIALDEARRFVKTTKEHRLNML